MRARIAGIVLLCALSFAAVPGCGKDAEGERRRELLKPPDPKRKAAEAREKRRLFDREGELLPSGEKVAGIMLPKGLTLYRQNEGQSYYKGSRVSVQQLERFFTPQLLKADVARTASMVRFADAVPHSDPKAAPIELRISKLRGAELATEVYVRQFLPAPKRDRPKLDPAQIEQARRFAD